MKTSLPKEEELISGSGNKMNIFLQICLTAAVMLILSLLVYIFKIPNPNIILMTGLAVFTSLYGYKSGITAGIIMFSYSMFFFSTDNSFIRYDWLNLQKIIIIGLGTILNVLFIGHLKKKQLETMNKMAQLNYELKLNNHALEEATVTDSLTGVKNRFAFRRDYTQYEGCNIHVMMLDVDDFKNINDQYGHSMGDEVLKEIGKAIKDVFGKKGSYRYGGDEFLIVTENTEENQFKILVEKLKEQIKSIGIETSPPINVHFSGGYVYGEVKFSDDLRLMLQFADGNLYKAKNAGKDKFVGSAYLHGNEQQ